MLDSQKNSQALVAAIELPTRHSNNICDHHHLHGYLDAYFQGQQGQFKSWLLDLFNYLAHELNHEGEEISRFRYHTQRLHGLTCALRGIPELPITYYARPKREYPEQVQHLSSRELADWLNDLSVFMGIEHSGKEQRVKRLRYFLTRLWYFLESVGESLTLTYALA